MICPVVDLTDETIETPCGHSWDCAVGCLPGRISDLLWVNPDENGVLTSISEQADVSIVYDYGFSSLLVYADNDRITIRSRRDTALIEMELVRLPAGIFDFPPTYQCPSPLPPDCETGG